MLNRPALCSQPSTRRLGLDLSTGAWRVGHRTLQKAALLAILCLFWATIIVIALTS
jgi:hypothetical protein